MSQPFLIQRISLTVQTNARNLKKKQRKSLKWNGFVLGGKAFPQSAGMNEQKTQMRNETFFSNSCAKLCAIEYRTYFPYALPVDISTSTKAQLITTYQQNNIDVSFRGLTMRPILSRTLFA